MGKMIFNQEESFFSLTVSTLSTQILRFSAERFAELTIIKWSRRENISSTARGSQSILSSIC